MKISIFPEIKQKSAILTWMIRQKGFVATDLQAKVPNVCGLREIPAKDKYSNPTLEVLTKNLAVANEIVGGVLGVLSKKYLTHLPEIEVQKLKFGVVAKAHDFWKVCRALKTIYFVNTEKEMVKGYFEGELIAGEVYLKDGEVTFSGRMRDEHLKIRVEDHRYFTNQEEVVQWQMAHPLNELEALTSEISTKGKPRPKEA
ncbi:MAG: hypothetical protein QME57_04540 [Patescibacteria group bacterium]|nr:hypothetical protein [Patescibacteria group bacterium]